MTEREKLIDLMIEAKKTDPETGGFTEWLADYLLEHWTNPISNTKNYCLICQKSNGRRKINFCPNCGAKMDKE